MKMNHHELMSHVLLE